MVGRCLVAVLLGVGLAFRAHSGGWENPHPICNGGWEEFLVYLAYLVVGIALIEILHWIIWYCREGRKWLERPAELDADGALIRGGELIAPHGLVSGLVFALGVLWVARRYFHAPNPCVSYGPGYFNWNSIPGALVFAYGALAIGEYIVYLGERRSSRIPLPRS